jgi:DNA-binding NtrC family response regulator
MAADAKTVLLADDDKLVLASFRYAFDRKGYRVLLAENGNVALQHLESGPVDIVFLDILMPQKEGLETLLEMRQRFPAVPVYVMSGGGVRNTHDFLAVAEKFGATGILRKPVTPAVLIELIEGLPQKFAHASTAKSA